MSAICKMRRENKKNTEGGFLPCFFVAYKNKVDY